MTDMHSTTSDRDPMTTADPRRTARDQQAVRRVAIINTFGPGFRPLVTPTRLVPRHP